MNLCVCLCVCVCVCRFCKLHSGICVYLKFVTDLYSGVRGIFNEERDS